MNDQTKQTLTEMAIELRDELAECECKAEAFEIQEALINILWDLNPELAN